MRVIVRASAIAASLCVLLVSAFSAAACGRAPAEAATPATTTAVADATPPPAVDAAVPHGDHSAHHGGSVWMRGEVHFEVILDPQGHHRLYFSDATRQDLPASIASYVTITIERPGAEKEIVKGTIDEQGESWLAEGTPVLSKKNVSARVAFAMKGEDEYFIDLPFSFEVPSSTE